MDKLYYTIGEVAELLSTSTSQLRYWSGEFTLNVRKNRKGDRLFQKEDLDKLRMIQKLLKEDGFTIDGAKKKIKSMNKSEISSEVSDIMIKSEPQPEFTEEYQLKTLAKSDIIIQLKSIKYHLQDLKYEIETKI